MSKIKTGIVGLGHIGKIHARILSQAADAEFSAIFDKHEETVRQVSEQYGVRAAGSLEEFASMVDAATVATPTPSHYEIGKFLLGRKKHLLIEKPITENTAQAAELIDLAKAQGCVLQVGHVERFNPVLDALGKHLTTPRFIESHRLSPYPNRSIEIGVVLDLMIHDLEIILHLVGSPVKSIDAVGMRVLSKGEDIANARLRFENGCVANVTVSRVSPDKFRQIRVFQPDAYIALDYQHQTGEIFRLSEGKIAGEPLEIEKGEPLKREVESFLRCCIEGAKPRVSGHEAAAALELALEITRLIETQG
ncbi:MAG TPA: Gfo/Idh/MocA family oxidoreductase [Chthoniobacteraceae bacterium]|nr:Gfo/Idh/MocA family oxidoreductase [Chthoniobacteraceae bacterium]